MTKKDFLNALIDPTHSEVKVKLRTLRSELRAIGWQLKYRYHRKNHTFYLMMCPTSVTLVTDTTKSIAYRLVHKLHDIRNISMQQSIDRQSNIYADIYIVR